MNKKRFTLVSVVSLMGCMVLISNLEPLTTAHKKAPSCGSSAAKVDSPPSPALVGGLRGSQLSASAGCLERPLFS